MAQNNNTIDDDECLCCCCPNCPEPGLIGHQSDDRSGFSVKLEEHRVLLAGILIAVIVLLFILGIIHCFCKKKRKTLKSSGTSYRKTRSSSKTKKLSKKSTKASRTKRTKHSTSRKSSKKK